MSNNIEYKLVEGALTVNIKPHENCAAFTTADTSIAITLPPKSAGFNENYQQLEKSAKQVIFVLNHQLGKTDFASNLFHNGDYSLVVRDTSPEKLKPDLTKILATLDSDKNITSAYEIAQKEAQDTEIQEQKTWKISVGKIYSAIKNPAAAQIQTTPEIRSTLEKMLGAINRLLGRSPAPR
ncbi:MAG: hypothetical protein EBR02_03545 [Alphaproteobacteria bacterium]|nr:hypothetical protein [Alphaproteobacteria bacterium]